MIQKTEWNDEYLLGVPKVDMQHKKLVVLINNFYDITQESEGEYYTKVSDTVKKILDYTIYHFKEEEAMLLFYGYATTDFHKMQHDLFIKEITNQIEQVVDSTQEDALKFYPYLMTWLVTHIAKADKAWSYFVLPKLSEDAQSKII